MTTVTKKTNKHCHKHTNIDLVLEQVKKAKLRLTEPRRAILSALVDNHGPFSAEEIHRLFCKKVCDLVTIYRCLSSLTAAGIIRRCEFGDGTARYEISGKEGHHHHVICRKCKKIEILDDCELENIDRVATRRGFVDITHSLEFFGICPSCK